MAKSALFARPISDLTREAGHDLVILPEKLSGRQRPLMEHNLLNHLLPLDRRQRLQDRLYAFDRFFPRN
ncbi:hypothetical protein NI18_02535 [Sphingomonas sp. Ant20]|nr:hypothetical protein NI18_02535 [Sphingomonas sp. Ant20]